MKTTIEAPPQGQEPPEADYPHQDPHQGPEPPHPDDPHQAEGAVSVAVIVLVVVP